MAFYPLIKGVERRVRRLFKKKKQTTKFERLQEKFYKRYPDYVVGVGTYGIPEVHDWKEGTTLSIGRYCSISSNVHIYLGGNHRKEWVSTYPFSEYLEGVEYISGTGVSNGNVVVGNDVWLCANSIILSGVTIGDGAIVANGAVVTKDVEPYAIVGGNPAKHIGYRFSKEVREALMLSQWWTWPVEEIKTQYALLNSDDISEFIRYAQEREN